MLRKSAPRPNTQAKTLPITVSSAGSTAAEEREQEGEEDAGAVEAGSQVDAKGESAQRAGEGDVREGVGGQRPGCAGHEVANEARDECDRRPARSAVAHKRMAEHVRQPGQWVDQEHHHAGPSARRESRRLEMARHADAPRRR